MVKKIFNKKIFLISFVLIIINISTLLAAIRFQQLNNINKQKKYKNKKKNDNYIANDDITSNIVVKDNDNENLLDNTNINLNIVDEVIDEDEDEHDYNDDKQTVRVVLLRYIWVSFFLYNLLSFDWGKEGFDVKEYIWSVPSVNDNLYVVYRDCIKDTNAATSMTYTRLESYFKTNLQYYDITEMQFLPFEVNKNEHGDEYIKKELSYINFVEKFLNNYYQNNIKGNIKRIIDKYECTEAIDVIFQYLNDNYGFLNSDDSSCKEYMWVFTLFFGFCVFALIMDTINGEEPDVGCDFESSKTFNVAQRHFYLNKLHTSLFEKYKIYIKHLFKIINNKSIDANKRNYLILGHKENCIYNKYFLEYFKNIYYRPATLKDDGSISLMDCFSDYICP